MNSPEEMFNPDQKIDTSEKQKVPSKLLKVALSVMLAAALTGCAKAEGKVTEEREQKNYEKPLRVYSPEELDVLAADSIRAAGGTEDEIKDIQADPEYQRVRADLNREPKEFISWLQEERKDPLHSEEREFGHESNDFNRLFAEQELRETNPAAVGYEAHEGTYTPEPDATLWQRITGESSEDLRVRFDRLVHGPKIEYNVKDLNELNRITFNMRGVDPVSTAGVDEHRLLLVALDELNPGLLQKMAEAENENNPSLISGKIIFPDLGEINQ